MTRVRLDDRSLSLFKSNASRQLPGVQYGHRLEVLARGLGFKTWAAFNAHRKQLSDSSLGAIGAARPIDISAMLERLVEFGHHTAGSLSFVPLEDDEHFFSDIEGVTVERMMALRSLFAVGEGERDPCTAVARVLMLAKVNPAHETPAQVVVPALDILRDLGYIGPYDREFDLDEFSNVMGQLLNLRVTVELPKGTMRMSVFSEIWRDLREEDLEETAQLRFVFTREFFPRAQAILCP